MPTYEYKPIAEDNCDYIIERPFYETNFVERCPVHHTTHLYRRVMSKPYFNTVWHDHYSPTTGQVVSDRKQMLEQLHVKSETVSERLNFPHSFVPVELSDPAFDRGGEGLDSTHDAHVKLGLKESKGKFVHQMSDKKKPEDKKL